MNLKLTVRQRRAGYVLFALLAFVVALRETLPAEALRERLVMEAAARGWQVSIDQIGPAGLIGVSMRSIRLESREGLRIPLDRLDATLRLWPLFLGRRGIAFDVRLFGGRVRGFVEQSRKGPRVSAEVAGVDLSQALPLRRATGLDLAGVVEGGFDLALDEREPTASAGRVDLRVKEAALNGGELPVMGGALTLPKVVLGQVTAEGAVKDGKLTFARLDAKGQDLSLEGDGLYLVLQPRLLFAPIFGKARLKVEEGFWAKGGMASRRPLLEAALAQARGKDGSYGFQIFGTLSQPRANLSP